MCIYIYVIIIIYIPRLGTEGLEGGALWTPPPTVPQKIRHMSRPMSPMHTSRHYTCFGNWSQSGLVWGWGCSRGLWSIVSTSLPTGHSFVVASEHCLFGTRLFSPEGDIPVERCRNICFAPLISFQTFLAGVFAEYSPGVFAGLWYGRFP